MEQLFCSKCGKVNWSKYSETCECREPDFKYASWEDYYKAHIEKKLDNL